MLPSIRKALTKLMMARVVAASVSLMAVLGLAACGGGSTSSLGTPALTSATLPPASPSVGPSIAPSPSAAPSPSPSPTSSSAAPLTITSGQPPSGVVGAAYGNSHTLWTCIPGSARCYWERTGSWTGFELSANRPYSRIGTGVSLRWSWSSAIGSSLPPGLMIVDPLVSCGFGGRCDCGPNGCGYAPAIVGTPAAAGTYHVIVTVVWTPLPREEASASYTITIAR